MTHPVNCDCNAPYPCGREAARATGVRMGLPEYRGRMRRALMAAHGLSITAAAGLLAQYEDAVAHGLAKQIYAMAEDANVPGQRSFASGLLAAGVSIDPEAS